MTRPLSSKFAEPREGRSAVTENFSAPTDPVMPETFHLQAAAGRASWSSGGGPPRQMQPGPAYPRSQSLSSHGRAATPGKNAQTAEVGFHADAPRLDAPGILPSDVGGKSRQIGVAVPAWRLAGIGPYVLAVRSAVA